MDPRNSTSPPQAIAPENEVYSWKQHQHKLQQQQKLQFNNQSNNSNNNCSGHHISMSITPNSTTLTSQSRGVQQMTSGPFVHYQHNLPQGQAQSQQQQIKKDTPPVASRIYPSPCSVNLGASSSYSSLTDLTTSQPSGTSSSVVPIHFTFAQQQKQQKPSPISTSITFGGANTPSTPQQSVRIGQQTIGSANMASEMTITPPTMDLGLKPQTATQNVSFYYTQQQQQQQSVNSNDAMASPLQNGGSSSIVRRRYHYTKSKLPPSAYKQPQQQMTHHFQHQQIQGRQGGFHPYSHNSKANVASKRNGSTQPKLRIITGFTNINDFNRYAGVRTYTQYSELILRQFFFSTIVKPLQKEQGQKKLIWPSTRLCINNYFNDKIQPDENKLSIFTGKRTGMQFMEAFSSVRDRVSHLLSVSQVNAISIYLASYYVHKIQEFWVTIKNEDNKKNNSSSNENNVSGNVKVDATVRAHLEELMGSPFNTVSGQQCGTHWYAFLVAALVIANKTLEDHTFKNQTWSLMAKCDSLLLNKYERIILSALKFECHMGKTAFEMWCRYLDEQNNTARSGSMPFANIFGSFNSGSSSMQSPHSVSMIPRSPTVTTPGTPNHHLMNQQLQQQQKMLIAQRYHQQQQLQKHQQQLQQQQQCPSAPVAPVALQYMLPTPSSTTRATPPSIMQLPTFQQLHQGQQQRQQQVPTGGASSSLSSWGI